MEGIRSINPKGSREGTPSTVDGRGSAGSLSPALPVDDLDLFHVGHRVLFPSL